MSYRINTSIASNRAIVSLNSSNDASKLSLERLSSGIRINSSADDASGMNIADSLRSHAASLGQANKNANDAIGIAQIADKAIDEQVKIVDTIKTKLIQSAQDGQSSASRKSIQSDIDSLLGSLKQIANTTTYNGYHLLDGNFTNKLFQIGASSNQTVQLSIGSTQLNKLGSTSYTQSKLLPIDQNDAFGNVAIKLNDIQFSEVKIGYKNGEGIGELAKLINSHSDKTGIRATYEVEHKFSEPNQEIQEGVTPPDFAINDVTIGTVSVEQGDINGNLVNAINHASSITGVTASVDSIGGLVLNSIDGRAIKLSTSNQEALESLKIATSNKNIQSIQSPAAGALGGTITYNSTLGRYEISTLNLSSKTYPIGTFIPSSVTKAEFEFNNFGASSEFFRIYKASDFTDAKLATGTSSPSSLTDYQSISDWLNNNKSKILNLNGNGTYDSSDADMGLSVNTSDPYYISSYDASNLVNSGNGTLNIDFNHTGEPLYIEAQGAQLTLEHAYLYTPDNSSLDPERFDFNGLISVGKLKLVETATGNKIDVKGTGLKFIGMSSENTIDNWSKNLLDINAIDKDRYDSKVHKNPIQESIDICDSALEQLDKIRSAIGAFQNQLESTMSNISVAKVMATASESQIRDVDFAQESANFSKNTILVQSGSFALAQANTDMQRVLSLLK